MSHSRVPVLLPLLPLLPVLLLPVGPGCPGSAAVGNSLQVDGVELRPTDSAELVGWSQAVR